MTIQEIIDAVPLCGCGSGTGWEIVLEILERAADHEKRGSFYDKAEDAAPRWVEFAAQVLGECRAELLEHGSGIGWAWLTDNGKALLAFLREHGTDDSTWPREES